MMSWARFQGGDLGSKLRYQLLQLVEFVLPRRCERRVLPIRRHALDFIGQACTDPKVRQELREVAWLAHRAQFGYTVQRKAARVIAGEVERKAVVLVVNERPPK